MPAQTGRRTSDKGEETMKAELILSAVSALLMTSAALADSGNRPSIETVISAPARVFSPQGFDDNDSTQVVIDGYLSNSCFQSGPAVARVDQAKKKIFLTHSIISF